MTRLYTNNLLIVRFCWRFILRLVTHIHRGAGVVPVFFGGPSITHPTLRVVGVNRHRA
jgi:hypothetical protein